MEILVKNMKGKKMTEKEIESNITKDMDRLHRNFKFEKFQLHLQTSKRTKFRAEDVEKYLK